MNELDTTILLTDEEGEGVEFEFLDLIVAEGRQGPNSEYVVLLPVEDDDELPEVVILEVIESDDESGEETYASVDDDDTLMRVFGIFRERNADLYDFLD